MQARCLGPMLAKSTRVGIAFKSIYQPSLISERKGVLEELLPVPRDKISTTLISLPAGGLCFLPLLTIDQSPSYSPRTLVFALLGRGLCYLPYAPSDYRHLDHSETCRTPSSRRGSCHSPYRHICASVARYRDSRSCRPFRLRVRSRIRLPHAQPTTSELAT